MINKDFNVFIELLNSNNVKWLRARASFINIVIPHAGMTVSVGSDSSDLSGRK